MLRGSSTSSPTLRVGVLLLVLATSTLASAAAEASHSKAPRERAATGGFVKDRTLARVLGETLFRDTVDLMAASPGWVPIAAGTGTPGTGRDNSAVAQVARALLAHQTLERYLWLIRHAYADSLWTGGDRDRIEQHFPLIWRTSILLYESSLDASANRVRVCAPADNPDDGFDCRDELEAVRMVPIPSDSTVPGLDHRPNIG